MTSDDIVMTSYYPNCLPHQVMAYRRQRVLNDLRDPTKRAPFATHNSFLRKYAAGPVAAEYIKSWQISDGLGGEVSLPTSLTGQERRAAAEGVFLRQQLRRYDDEAAAAAAREAAEAAAAASRPLPRARSLPALESSRAKGQGWLRGNQKEIVMLQANIRAAGEARKQAQRLGILLQSEEIGLQKDSFLISNKMTKLKAAEQSKLKPSQHAASLPAI